MPSFRFFLSSTRSAILGLGLTLSPLPSLLAQTLSWDASDSEQGLQDGTGIWNLTNFNWSLTGADNQAWSNLTSPYSARFGSANGPAGTVTLGENIRLQDLTFENAGSQTYVLNAASNAQLILSQGSVITNNANANLQLSVVGNEGWTKRGNQTLTLSGGQDNEFSGDIQIEAGRVIMSKTAGRHALQGEIVVKTGASLSWGASHQLEDSSDLVIDGGSFSFNNHAETFRNYTQKSGGHTGNSIGVITITEMMRLESGSGFTVNSGGTMNVGSADFTGMSSTVNSLLIGAVSTTVQTSFNIGSGGLTLSGQVIRLNVSSAANHLGNRIALLGDLNATGVNTFTSEDVAPNTSGGISELYLGTELRTLRVTSDATHLTRHLQVTGTGGLDKQGAGILNLNTTSNQNLIRLPLLKVSEGILRLSSHEQISNTSDVLMAGGKFEANGRTETFRNLTLHGGEFDTGLDASISITQLEGNNAGRLTIASGAIFKTTDATLTGSNLIWGANFSTQVTRFHLDGGTLNMNAQRFNFYRPTVEGVGGNELLLEGNLKVTGSSSMGFDSTGAIVDGAVSQFRIEGTSQRQIQVQEASDILTIGIILAGNGNWEKTGLGTLTLNGANLNTFRGTSTLSEGNFTLAKNNNVTAIGGRLNVQGGTLTLSTHGQFHEDLVLEQTAGTIILGNRDVTFTDFIRHGGEVRGSSGQINITGTLKGINGTSNNSGAGSAIYTLNSGGVTTARTVDFSESTKRLAILIGGNVPTLTRFVVGAGGLKLHNNDIVLNRDNAGSEFELQGDVTASGTNAFNQGGLGAAGTRIAQIQHGSASRVWNITSGQTTSAIPIVSTGGGLTKTGTGTLQLNANNTYQGKTTIQNGILRLGASANLSQSSWIELGAGAQFDVSALTQGFRLNQSENARLSGQGTLLGNLALGQGASLRPGMSSDSLSIASAGAFAGKLLLQGNLTATQTSANLVAAFNLTSSALGDQISIAGNLALNQHSLLQVTFDSTFTSYQVGDSWTLMDWTGDFSSSGFQQGALLRNGDNSFANEGQIDLPTLQTGWYWQLSDMNVDQALQITIVPEPAHATLSLLGLGVLAMTRRRRNP